ncbi:MAG: DUF1028 domain-containing protein [Thermoleophilia bacterium]|nr:DUF1028 domain-containing protein [Thermoleophilia bacterium]
MFSTNPARVRSAPVTYSLVARDAETGQLGVGVQTKAFAVGRTVPWALAGVGAVATQSVSERSYGPLGLALLDAGRAPDEALRGLLAADALAEVRQVAIVDAEGQVATHTGAGCIPEAGHVAGEGFSAQANMMRSAEVWPAMAEAFTAAEGTLARRLLAALDAAEAAGGDFRGRRTAALLVVGGERTGAPWDAEVVDLRVDDHPEPLEELRRLLDLEEAYRRLGSHSGDLPDEELAAARSAGVGEADLAWFAVSAAARAGDLEEARRRLEHLVAVEPRWQGAWAAVAALAAHE